MDELSGDIKTVELKPNYQFTFYRDGVLVGTFDLNGPKMIFTGDVEASAQIFIDLIADKFEARLKQERDSVATTLTCVYCGKAYPEGTPPHGSQVLTDHIKVCPSHPMRKAEEIILKLRLALEGVIGYSTQQDLLETKLGLKLIPMPEEERVKMLNAIDVLLEFHNA